MPSREKLRQRVADQLEAGISAEAVLAELLRQGVPETQARAIVGEPRTEEEEKTSVPAALVERPAFQSDDACAQQVARAGRGLGGKRSPYAKAVAVDLPIAVKAAEEKFKAGVHVAGPVARPEYSPQANLPAGQDLTLASQDRKFLWREVSRVLWYFLVLVPPSVFLGAFLVVVAITIGLAGNDPSEFVSPILIREAPSLAHAAVVFPSLFFLLTVCVLGLGIQLASIGRCLGDLLPGRVLTVRAYLRQPANLSTARKEFYSVGLAGRRRRYRLRDRSLYLFILRAGLERPYRVYYSPRTRWVWRLEPEESPAP